MIPNVIRRKRPRPEPVLKLLPVPNPKPKLEMLVLPVFRVKYRKLEAYIASVYRFEFDFLFATGQIAGQCLEYNVSGKLDGHAWQQRAHELRCGIRTRDVSLILNVLVADGFIPAGKYIIDTHQPPKPATFSEISPDDLDEMGKL
jgi:hypothetical protein